MTDRITTASDGTPSLERTDDSEQLEAVCADCGEPADGLDRLTPVCQDCAEQRRAERRLERGRED